MDYRYNLADSSIVGIRECQLLNLQYFGLIVTIWRWWWFFSTICSMLPLQIVICLILLRSVQTGTYLHQLWWLYVTGETKRKFESVYSGGTMDTPDSGRVFQYWHCCGSEDPFDPGCTAAPHSSYDDWGLSWSSSNECMIQLFTERWVVIPSEKRGFCWKCIVKKSFFPSPPEITSIRFSFWASGHVCRD